MRSEIKWFGCAGILLGAAIGASCSSSNNPTGASTGAGGSTSTGSPSVSVTVATSGVGGAGSGASSSASGVGGACSMSEKIADLPTGSQPYGLYVDATNVYWTNFGSGEVMQAKLDGSSPIAITKGEIAPVAVQSEGGFVYWVSYDTNSVARKAPVGGGAVIDLSVAPAAREIFVDQGYVFWSGEPDDIQRADVTGVPEGGTALLLTNNVLPNGLAVDATNVYWVNRFDGYVKKADRDLGNETALANGDIPWDIAVDDTYVYWTEQGSPGGAGKVMRVAKAGAAPEMLAMDAQGPQGIAIDATRVYWANKNDGTIKAVPLAGGMPTVIACGQEKPQNVVVDATHVYWTNFAGDSVMKIPK